VPGREMPPNQSLILEETKNCHIGRHTGAPPVTVVVRCRVGASSVASKGSPVG
jgi:hypothetical protein